MFLGGGDHVRPAISSKGRDQPACRRHGGIERDKNDHKSCIYIGISLVSKNTMFFFSIVDVFLNSDKDTMSSY